MLWVDRYRPGTFEELDLHSAVTDTLNSVANADMPHLLFHGPSGGGKRTRVIALLHHLYGLSPTSLKLEHRSLQVNESKTIDVPLLTSLHHLEVNPSDAGNTYDRVVVMQLIREVAQTVPVHRARNVPFKVVILNEAERMSIGAQQALRRTMEKYTATCRLVLLCGSTSRMVEPLRSRCLAIRVPSFQPDELLFALQRVCRLANFSPVASVLKAIASKSEGNLRRAILMLEASRAVEAKKPEDVPVADWKMYIEEIAGDIVMEQSPRKLYEIRGKFYDLLCQCIPGDVILRELLRALFRVAPAAIHGKLTSECAAADETLKRGSKAIMHIESFAAQAMRLIHLNVAANATVVL